MAAARVEFEAVVVIVMASASTGQDPMQILRQLRGQLTDSFPKLLLPLVLPARRFASAILGDTELTPRHCGLVFRCGA